MFTVRGALSLLSIGIGAVTLFGSEGVAWADRNAAPIATLEVLLSLPPALPDTVRTSFVGEVTSIWRRQGVAIQWLSGAVDQSRLDRTLRILVRPSSTSARLDSNPVTVGELLRSKNGRAIAVTSLAAAERIVSEMQPRSASIQDAMYFHCLGLVLGRAAAHEIGHYLLDTREHARYGLMKARFNASDFADLRSGTFELDPDSRAFLENRFGREVVRAAAVPVHEDDSAAGR